MTLDALIKALQNAGSFFALSGISPHDFGNALADISTRLNSIEKNAARSMARLDKLEHAGNPGIVPPLNTTVGG
jgi:hypothetical protein